MEKYEDIVKEEKDLQFKLSCVSKPSLEHHTSKQRTFKAERDLRNKYKSVKDHRHHLQAKYRNIQSHYPQGITGVEQPGDGIKTSKQQESIIYKGYNNLLASNQKSSEFRQSNRLKSKSNPFINFALTLEP